jgi:hypothetical protein
MVSLVVIVTLLELGLDGIGGHGAGNTPQDLAQLAAAHLAAQEGPAGAAYRRGEETAVLLLLAAVRTDGAAALPLMLQLAVVVTLAVCVSRL